MTSSFLVGEDAGGGGIHGVHPHPNLPPSKGGRGQKGNLPWFLVSSPRFMGKDQFSKGGVIFLLPFIKGGREGFLNVIIFIKGLGLPTPIFSSGLRQSEQMSLRPEQTILRVFSRQASWNREVPGPLRLWGSGAALERKWATGTEVRPAKPLRTVRPGRRPVCSEVP